MLFLELQLCLEMQSRTSVSSLSTALSLDKRVGRVGGLVEEDWPAPETGWPVLEVKRPAPEIEKGAVLAIGDLAVKWLYTHVLWSQRRLDGIIFLIVYNHPYTLYPKSHHQSHLEADEWFSGCGKSELLRIFCWSERQGREEEAGGFSSKVKDYMMRITWRRWRVSEL